MRSDRQAEFQILKQSKFLSELLLFWKLQMLPSGGPASPRYLAPFRRYSSSRGTTRRDMSNGRRGSGQKRPYHSGDQCSNVQALPVEATPEYQTK